MPPIQPPVTVPAEDRPPQVGFYRPEQSAQLAAKQKELNRGARPAFIPRATKEDSVRRQVYIFNVGPKLQEGCGASYGRVMIQACPEGKEYSMPFVVPGLPYEQYQKEVGRMSADFHGDEDSDVPGFEPGWDWACQAILGFTDSKGHWEGKFLSPNNSLEKFGIGISRTWPPAKEDIELARNKMMAHYRKLVQEAREAHAVGKLSAVVQDHHFVAAHALGLNAESGERWLEFSAPAPEKVAKSLCPKCRKPYDEGTVEHECGFILDKKQYDKWVAEGLISKASK